jgi:hypothetical protein
VPTVRDPLRCSRPIFGCCVLSVTAPNQLPTLELPPGKLLLIGDVTRPQIFDVAGLRALPPRTITVTFKAGRGTQTHTYVGPLLLDVLAQAGLMFDPMTKNDNYVTSSA